MAAMTIQFPRPMKRGAKVRRGPCADILQFPKRLVGEDLKAAWMWLRDNHGKWKNEETVGYAEDWQRRWKFEEIMAVIESGDSAHLKLTDDALRKQMAEWRCIVEKRIAMKDWLDEQGINWTTAKTPQDALEFLYDRIGAQPLTPCA